MKPLAVAVADADAAAVVLFCGAPLVAVAVALALLAGGARLTPRDDMAAEYWDGCMAEVGACGWLSGAWLTTGMETEAAGL